MGGGGPTTDATSSSHMVSEQLEEASPISCRPPAIGNSDELMRLAIGGGGVSSGGNRKLAEVGYKRSAKKCKEKFKNVQKYYKRRKDGKTSKFFTELEALHRTTSTNLSHPISVGIPMPTSSVRIRPTTTATLPMPGSAPPPITTPFGISFSSSSQGYQDEEELGGEPSNMAGTSRKRQRQSSSSSKRMMEFFQGLMKRLMQEQEALQKMFLEAIEKREQERLIREDTWKRQEMARLARQHEIIAQQSALASSRDAPIVSFLQKFTGQTIELPSTATIPAVPPPPAQPTAAVVPPSNPIPTAAPPLHQPQSIPQQQKQSHLQHQQQPPPRPQNTEVVKYNQQPIMAISEQKVAPEEIGGSESNELASSRWPKAEVLALINIRSGIETRYQEAGLKGPLWEEISSAMSRMGYKRNPKRCKEKWENINKYYKKVKESDKKRPDDAKTCPYFHQLDALYRNKILGGGFSSFSDQNRLEGETSQPQQHQEPPPSDAPPITEQQPTHDQSENKTGAAVDVFGKGNGKATKKSEDIVREIMEEQEMQ